jgi:hypothetical protein
MIHFFHKIRQKLADDNKPLKYRRFAIGEIVPVVIRILPALSNHGWNEACKTRWFGPSYLKYSSIDDSL